VFCTFSGVSILIGRPCISLCLRITWLFYFKFSAVNNNAYRRIISFHLKGQIFLYLFFRWPKLDWACKGNHYDHRRHRLKRHSTALNFTVFHRFTSFMTVYGAVFSDMGYSWICKSSPCNNNACYDRHPYVLYRWTILINTYIRRWWFFPSMIHSRFYLSL